MNQFAIKYISKTQFIDIDSSNVKFRLFNKIDIIQKIKYFTKKLNDSIQIALVIQNQKMNNLLNLNWINLNTIFKSNIIPHFVIIAFKEMKIELKNYLPILIF